jgi:hypothetical protein
VTGTCPADQSISGARRIVHVDDFATALLHVFAKDRLPVEETAEERTRAAAALDDHLLTTADTAGSLVAPDVAATAALTLNQEWAAAWLDREYTNWAGALRRTAAGAEHQQLIDLARRPRGHSETLWQQVGGAPAGAWPLVTEPGSRPVLDVHRNVTPARGR